MAVKKPTPVWEQIADFESGNSNVLQSTSPPTDKGYDIEFFAKIPPERRAQIMASANGVMYTAFSRVRFFVNAVDVSIGMGNTRAQGRRVQDLYPRSFNMPHYRIMGQSLTQEDYGLLCEFVHEHQQDAIGNGIPMHLWVREGVPYKGLESSWFGPRIAGWHKPIECRGFVLRMPRKHERFVYTPKFEFEFAVTESSVGIFSGKGVSPEELANPEITKFIGSPFTQAAKGQVSKATQSETKGLKGSSGTPPEKIPGTPGSKAAQPEENLLEKLGTELPEVAPSPPKPSRKK